MGRGEIVAQESRVELLEKLQSYNFAAYDMLLYLDTHANDKKAFDTLDQMTVGALLVTKVILPRECQIETAPHSC